MLPVIVQLCPSCTLPVTGALSQCRADERSLTRGPRPPGLRAEVCAQPSTHALIPQTQAHPLLLASFPACSRWDSNPHCRRPQRRASCHWATRTSWQTSSLSAAGGPCPGLRPFSAGRGILRTLRAIPVSIMRSGGIRASAGNRTRATALRGRCSATELKRHEDDGWSLTSRHPGYRGRNRTCVLLVQSQGGMPATHPVSGSGSHQQRGTEITAAALAPRHPSEPRASCAQGGT